MRFQLPLLVLCYFVYLGLRQRFRIRRLLVLCYFVLDQNNILVDLSPFSSLLFCVGVKDRLGWLAPFSSLLFCVGSCEDQKTDL